MTLDTRFAITSPVLKPRDVFDYCNTLLAAVAGWPVERITYDAYDISVNKWHTDAGWYNTLGQGLPALMDVKYGADGPLKRDCYCDEDRTDDVAPDWKCAYCRAPEAFVEVSFDTAYSYKTPSGLGCGDLHAALVDALGAWCDSRGLTWHWQNEFTGEWHEGRDGLSELGQGGAAATEWFTASVLPVIAAHANR